MTARRLRGAGVWLLAAIAYIPSLTAAPGRMPTDTKLYLYLDPKRLIGDAVSSWDTRQFAGWVPHQTIAYLWPSGPWFAAFDTLGVGRVLDHHRDGARVGEDPVDLRRGAGLVHRHHDGPCEEEREVDEGPVVGRPCEEGDLVAGLDAAGRESLRERDHLAVELRGGDVSPPVPVRDGEQGQRRRRLHPLDEDVRGVRGRVGGHDGGDVELYGAHGRQLLRYRVASGATESRPS